MQLSQICLQNLLGRFPRPRENARELYYTVLSLEDDGLVEVQNVLRRTGKGQRDRCVSWEVITHETEEISVFSIGH
jgi:hypothetical protein